MSQTRFSPEAWNKGGQGYLDEAGDLRSAVASYLNTLDVGSLGCTNGEHPIDIALALAVPVIKDAFLEACENLASNLEAVGTSLQDTGATYAEFEAVTTEHASQSTTL